MIKPISISLSPNTEVDDLKLTLKLLFQPWRWKRGKAGHLLEEEFKRYLEVKHAFAFNSGRSSLMAILNSLDLKEGDEVLLQAFTCNAAVNPILWSGLKPVFVDCDEETFNLDVADLKRKITSSTKAVIVQHTFGLPALVEQISKICQENNLILIEDCAHSLGATYQGKKVGTFASVAFFSFSRDKVISSVYGGMATTNDSVIAQRLKKYSEEVGLPSNGWTFQQLLHPLLINWLVLPTYSIFGKYLLVFFQWFKILSKAVHWKEKRGLKPNYFPKQLPNVLALLALNQFKKLERFNQHRQKIASFYREELKDTSFSLPLNSEQIYLRFTLKHQQAHQIIKKAWENNLLLGDWYTTAIAPHDTKLKEMHYLVGSCPQSERLAQITLNLPTQINITQKEAKKIVNFLKTF